MLSPLSARPPADPAEQRIRQLASARHALAGGQANP
jgi:hypothetical protein